MNADPRDIGRLLRLKEQRLDAARAAHAAAIAAVRAAERQVEARDAAIRRLEARQQGLVLWFADPPSDPRLIEAALGRREALADQRGQEIEARTADITALADAEARRTETARGVAQAQGRRDATARLDEQLRRLLVRQAEARLELELEERRSGAGGFV